MKLDEIKSLRKLSIASCYQLWYSRLYDFLEETGCDLKFPFLRRYFEDGISEKFAIVAFSECGTIEPWYFKVDMDDCVIEEIIYKGAFRETVALIQWLMKNISWESE